MLGKKLTITSEELEYNRQNNTAIFSGQVHAFQDSLDIYGDKMLVELKNDGSNTSEESSKIKYIKITGNVRIITDSEQITAEQAEYKPKQNSIVLKRNVELRQNNNVVTGDELIYDLENKSARIISKGEKQRIKAKFTFDNE